MYRLLSFLIIAGTILMQSAAAQFSRTLFTSYDQYRFSEITTRRFTHADLVKYLESVQRPLSGIMTVEKIGESAEHRSINLLTLGTGPTKVLLWSQMHGDEPTATMAIFDILNYISMHKDAPEVRRILSELTLLIIPMLNPDGAERFQRRTALGIDMNRDALRLQTPEARLLKATRDKYDPQIGFNLHDQDPRYTVGEKPKVAVISLLTPAYNVAKDDNAVRIRAKKVASVLTDVLHQFVPDHVAKYDDTFEPRAFGDNIQKWGTSVVLIESGGWKDDPEKMFIRKLNCVGLLTVFDALASQQVEKGTTASYEALPMNTKNLYDIIIEKATITYADGRPSLIADIAVNREEVRGPRGTQWQGRVVDVGDLSVFTCHEKWNGTGKTVEGTSVELNDIVDLQDLAKRMK